MKDSKETLEPINEEEDEETSTEEEEEEKKEEVEEGEEGGKEKVVNETDPDESEHNAAFWYDGNGKNI